MCFECLCCLFALGRVAPIFEVYGFPLTPLDVKRFIVAAKGDIDESSKMLMEYCTWREKKPQYNVPNGVLDCIGPEHVKNELNSGKAYILPGKSVSNEPILLVHGKLNDSSRYVLYSSLYMLRFMVIIIVNSMTLKRQQGSQFI